MDIDWDDVFIYSPEERKEEIFKYINWHYILFSFVVVLA